MKIPSTNDITQMDKKIEDIPEIRVWCHPHKIGKTGDDYWYTFQSFGRAIAFIKKHPEAEKYPLLAFRGKELNIFEMEE